MINDWEDVFTQWAKGPDDTERRKIENTEEQIKAALKNSSALRDKNIKVFTQGSYRNNTNVKHDSDVDIGILCTDVFYADYANDSIESHYSKIHTGGATYTYRQFKGDVQAALVAYFSQNTIKSGNKAFNIKETRRRVDADVSAFFEERYYTGIENYKSGAAMFADNNSQVKIINWPEQHFTNGVSKNKATNRKFKRVVRILKKLNYEMQDKRSVTVEIPSFLIECLTWNVPNDKFSAATYHETIRTILSYLFFGTTTSSNDKLYEKWAEVSGMKYLFGNHQKWTVEMANTFLLDAWHFIGYQ
jgi:hypothetical protein